VSDGRRLATQQAGNGTVGAIELNSPRVQRLQRDGNLSEETELGEPKVDTLAASSLAASDPVEALCCA
jgi:hypothetical protein